MSALADSIAIVGFGFSGLMVTAEIVHGTSVPRTLYIIDPTHDARGAAYGTRQKLHLLNVQAVRMGAFAAAPEGFFQWLQTDEGKDACADAGIAPIADPAAYAPRMIYGAYLASIWQGTKAIAAEKNCRILLVPSIATAIAPQGEALHVLTARGDAIAVHHAVLAMGNEHRRLYQHLPQRGIIQRPWEAGALDEVARTQQAVALIGTGLTAIDALLSLRAAGYDKKIHVFSRHGRLPSAHRSQVTAATLTVDTLFQDCTRVSHYLHAFRKYLRTHPAMDWRSAVDGLRPHTHALWRRLSIVDRQRFFARLAGIWGIHRHRMAEHVATRIDEEMAAQRCCIVAAQQLRVEAEETGFMLRWMQAGEVQQLQVQHLINCTGVELRISRSKNPLLQHMLANGVMIEHSTGVGIAVDAHHRPMGTAYGRLHALGGMLTGQLLESIAVPELRVQAQAIAKDILATIRTESGG